MLRLSFFATLLLYASNDLQGNFEKFLPCFVTKRLPPQKDGVLISLPAAERVFKGGKPDTPGLNPQDRGREWSLAGLG